MSYRFFSAREPDLGPIAKSFIAAWVAGGATLCFIGAPWAALALFGPEAGITKAIGALAMLLIPIAVVTESAWFFYVVRAFKKHGRGALKTLLAIPLILVLPVTLLVALSLLAMLSR